MNRVRKLGDKFQVLITPSIKVSPDSALMVGNWEDDELRNYYVLEYETLGDAMVEALNHPDIDWYRLVLNHKYIYQRLKNNIQKVIYDTGMTVEFKPHLMSPEMLKNTMFDRVQQGGERFNLRYGLNDIISFTIVNPYSKNLFKLANALGNYREHFLRDDLRIRERRLLNNKTICLYGVTEAGSVYEIRLVPTLLYHWSESYKRSGYLHPSHAEKLFQDTMKQQDQVDRQTIR